MNCNRRLGIAGPAAGASGHSSRAIGGDKGMKRCTRPICWLWAALVLGALAASPCAAAWSVGDDFDPASEPEGLVWADQSPITLPYCGGMSIVRGWNTYYMVVTDEHYDTHVKTEEGTLVDHVHHQKEYDASGAPTVANANTFWNARCGTTYFSDASTKHNCHSYAFSQVAGGTYNYWLDGDTVMHTVYYDEMTLTSKENVMGNDLLRYGASDHTTIVRTVGDGVPDLIEYQYAHGGVYRYEPPAAHAWDTPLCAGTIQYNVGVQIQVWKWDEDHHEDPGVYEVD